IPVVVRSHTRQAELFVGCLGEYAAREPRHRRWKAQRRPHAADVHVGNTVVDVPASQTHLIEPRRVTDVPLTWRAAHDRGQTRAAVDTILEDPDFSTIVEFDDVRRPICETACQTAIEYIARLDTVVR